MADEAKISDNFLSLLGNLQQRNVGNVGSSSNQRPTDHGRARPKINHQGKDAKEQALRSQTKNVGDQRNIDWKIKPRREDKSRTERTSSCGDNTFSGKFLSSLDDFQDLNSANKQNRGARYGQGELQYEPNESRHSSRADKHDSDCSNKTEESRKGSKGTVRNKTREDNRNHQGRSTQSVGESEAYGRGHTKNSYGPQSRESNADSTNEPRTQQSKKKTEVKPVRMMGYKFLESLLDLEDSYVVTTLASPKSGFKELLNDRPIRKDLLILIISVLNKVNHSQIDQLKMSILSETFSPEFFDEIKRFCAMACIEDTSNLNSIIEIFFQEILSLFHTVMNMFPSMMNDKIKSVMVALNLLMKHTKDMQGINVKDCLFEQWKTINDQISSYLEDKQRIVKEQYKTKENIIKTPNDFRDLPLVPTVNDFISSQPFLRHNITKGSFESAEHYLDIQYRLLREDFIAPLRTGIYEYVASLNSAHSTKKYNNVRIYSKVQFQASFKSRDVFGFLVDFDCDKKFPRNMNWEYSKRFMVGSLLLFTDNFFQTFSLATVASREEKQLKEGVIFVAFVPGTEAPSSIFEPGKYFTMAESEVYYEAYRHVLAALKRMNEENFPMKQYIVNVDTACFPPQYLINKTVYSLSGYNFDLLVESSWPSPQQLKLNNSQFQAFKAALTNDFVVIQGPPGTGKTFLALKIAEVLLKNEVSNDTPIVVICYTNHALDQFLEGILKFTNNLIRIGSRSQNEVIENYNIEKVRQLKRKESYNFYLSPLYKNTVGEKLELQEQLSHVEKKIEDLNSPIGILNLSVLRSVIAPHHYNELDGYVVDWLLCSDNPELLNQEAILGNETLSVNIASENQIAPSDIFENASEFQEEDVFIEKDDDENAQRLADMIEDDFFESDFMTEKSYISAVTYSLAISTLNMEIMKLFDDLHLVQEQSRQHYMLQNLIKTKDYHRHIIVSQYLKFKNLIFDPVKFDMLQRMTSVWEISGHDRWFYYMTWIHLYCSQLKQIIQHLTDRYQNVLSQLYELKQLEDLAFVKKAAVIGLTTSGAAKRRILLENLGTKIVIVEEAAEVLEAHIVTSLTQSVQHVILIGDHKQLKPNPAVYELAKKFKLDVSLFERMLSNGLGCHMLDVQHRMRPEIALLVKPIYPTLMDHPSTYDRRKVSGIDKFVFFLTHNNPEDQIPDSSSRQNKYEADFLMSLCGHLMLQGYQPEEITILATYTGQVWYMRKEKRILSARNPDWKRVRITPVDNFQGEENRIILLSLVRSNKEARIGFLSTENRVCVALSRAKEGLYIVGNMDNLTASSAIWPKIKEQLDQLNAVGQKLTLRCERHPEQSAQVSKAKDFDCFPEGGCTLLCDAELICGHKCPRKCHIMDQYHTAHECLFPCARPPCEVEGHKCPLKCKDTCKPCKIAVMRQLVCGHPIKLPCHVEPASASCLVSVSVELPKCGHQVDKPCYMDIELVRCTSACEFRLPCGHACAMKCHVNDDPEHIEVKCMKDCVKKNKTCRSNHPCKKRCWEPCGDCITLVRTKLTCGHTEEIPCSLDESAFKCKKPCTRKLACGHQCPLQCWISCLEAACETKVNKWCAFGHDLKKMNCCDPPENKKCLEPCTRTLPCGHPCVARCFLDCTKMFCTEEVRSSVAPACGHPSPNIPCRINKPDLKPGSDELLQLCTEPCREVRICGHQCKGTCGNCLQGRLHMPCEEPCNKLLICGHRCKAKCSELCPPCKLKTCFNTCFHNNKCNKKHSCDIPCEPCSKPCRWACAHHRCTKKCGEVCNRPACYIMCPDNLPCGHNCLGFCGEPHPPLCRTCDADNPDILASSYFSRFVLLEDCEHIVENEELEQHIANTEGTLLTCPKCYIPIVKTMRCRSIYIRYRDKLIKMSQSIQDEQYRLKKIHSRNVRLFRSDPTNSDLMNKMLQECSAPFHGMSPANYSRLILSCLLVPLASKCAQLFGDPAQTLTAEENHRLKLRLQYLNMALVPRMKRISYPDILQIELEVARILRAVSNNNLTQFWYDIGKYSWETDRRLVRVYNLEKLLRLSVTLRTRDVTKKWLVCDRGHLYVNEEEAKCVTCKDFEEEEKLRLEEAEKKQNVNMPGHSNRNVGTSEHIRVTNYNKGMRRGRGRGGNWVRGRGGRGRGRGNQ